MAESSCWIKVESKSNPGRCYYFNTENKKSTWKVPAQATETKSRPSREKAREATAWNSNSNNSNTASGRRTMAETPMDEGAQLGGVAMYRSRSDGTATTDGEAMEVEERWGSEEVVSMDVDLSEEEQLALIREIQSTRRTLVPSASIEGFGLPSNPTPPQYSEKLYVVLDTNVLVSHLQFLIELKDYAIKGVGRPILVVPWIVMQELDSLKTSKQSVSVRARKAIQLLHDCFSTRHPRVRGQTMEEAQTEVKNLAISNNDDRILHCCMLYREKVASHNGVVVLFSNDIQLCSKALVNNIRALNRKTLLTELRVMCRSSRAAPASYTHTQEFAAKVSDQLSAEQSRAQADDLLCESESLFREGLSVAVEREMIAAYDNNLWLSIVHVKPPWSLADLVTLLDKHWIAVFGLVMPRGLKETAIGQLLSHIRNRARMLPTFSDVSAFHSSSLAILQALGSQQPQSSCEAHCIAGLKVLVGRRERALMPLPQQPAGSSPPHLSMPGVSLQTTNATLAQPVPCVPSLYQPLSSNPAQLRQEATPLSPSRLELERMVYSVPSSAGDQLHWTLTLVLDTTKHSHARVIAESSQVTRSEALTFLHQLMERLTQIVSSIGRLLVERSIPNMRDLLVHFENYMATCLHISSPLTLDSLYPLMGNAYYIELLTNALSEYNTILEALRALELQL